MTRNFSRIGARLMAPDDRREDVDIGALLATLWRGKWVIALCAAAAILVGGYYAFIMATPVYRSTAVVMLETQPEQVIDLQSVVGGLSGETSVVNSEVEVLRSRSLMSLVAEKLNLAADPEFNAGLRPPGAVDEIKGAVKEWIVVRLRGLTGAAPEPAPQVSAEAAARRLQDKIVDALLERTTVTNVRQSVVFRITVETGSPEKSALIADTIVETYILNQLEVKFAATEQATSWLTDRVAELRVELEAAEARVAEFSAGTDLINPQMLRAAERQLKEMRDRIGDGTGTLAAATARNAALGAARDAGRAAQAEAASDAQLSELFARLGAGGGEAEEAAFDARFRQVQERAAIEVRRAGQQLAALRASAAEIEAEIASQSDDLIELQQLSREAEASRLLYEYFLGRLKETAAQQGIQRADSRILSNAVVPAFPSEPRKTMILAMAAVLGLMLGAALVLLREFRQETFRTARDLERATGQAVLGQIPLLPARRRKDALKYLAEKPASAAAEAVRNLRTSLLLSDTGNPPQVIMTTSSLPGEGKTTLALALAQNFSGLGKEVLLIEGDIRRRVFGQYLDAGRRDGLTSVLSGDRPLREAAARDERIGADVLVGGDSSANAADLFSSPAFAKLVEQARGEYDYVIIDTPPVLVVPDARVIARTVDSLLFAVKWDATSRGQVEEALRLFETVAQPVTGMVLCQVSPRGMRRYGHGGKYGAYSAYGAKYYTN